MDLSRIEWRKSSYTSSNGGTCVEVGVGPQGVAVRDSKDPDGAALVFSMAEWDVFIGHLKGGRIGPV
jgi:uncharacterized protein DUF397